MIYDACIIGGGPAGLLAAAKIAEAGKNVILLEKMEKTGRKLRISGKGRCNFTNNRGKDDFLEHIINGAEFLDIAYENFNSHDAIQYINSLGVETVLERGGRVFPKSGKAWDIAQAMVDNAKKSGATIKINAKVISASKVQNNIFNITLDSHETYKSRFLLIATGGASYPSTGSTGDGYTLAWKFGHDIVPIRPSLTHLVIKEHISPILLKNISTSILIDGKITSSMEGEADFNDRGLAGATILSQSQIAVDALLEDHKVSVLIDLKPALSEAQLISRLQRENTIIDSIAKDLLRKFIPKQLIPKILKDCHISSNDHIIETQYEQIAYSLKNMVFDVINYGDFEFAIVTAGGVSTEEIDKHSMESRICPNLYFAGEIIDVNAKTGGYNIQIALSTASLAAKSILKVL